MTVSVEYLTRNFIRHLQANFPSTVNTIFRYVKLQKIVIDSLRILIHRTGDKLSMGREATSSTEGVCGLCQVSSECTAFVWSVVGSRYCTCWDGD